MKKCLSLILVLVLSLSLFAACGKKSSNTASDLKEPVQTETPKETVAPVVETDAPKVSLGTISIASLKGPTTMGIVKLLDDASKGETSYEVESEIYGTADEILTKLIKGELNAAALPANVAATLYNKTEGKLQVACINTLGVISVLELGDSITSVADLAGKTVYSTGKGSTPEYGLNAILSGNGIDPASDLDLIFKSESTEIAAMLAGESAVEGTIAVLPQPYATTVLASNPDARIALNLNDEWAKAGLGGDMVTGVLVINKEYAKENEKLVNTLLLDYNDSTAWVNENGEAAGALIAELGIVPKAALATKALPYCSIVFKDGDEMKEALSGYLQILFDQNPAAVGGALPNDDFYYGA